MSNPYDPQPAEDSSRVSLPPAAGERIEPQKEIASKNGTVVDGDYYYDQNDEKPIPLEAERIVFEKGSTFMVILSWCLALFLSLPFPTMLTEGTDAVIDADHPLIWSFMLGVDLVIIVFLIIHGFLYFPSTDCLDSQGITLSILSRKIQIPWPHSRTGLYVRLVNQKGRGLQTAEVKVIRSDGSSALLPITFRGVDSVKTERNAVIQCSRIWGWAVAKGYTQESDEYIPLLGLGVQQFLRRRQEERYGLRAHVNDNQEDLQ